MLTLNDGRSELWQWDTGRTLAVDADCSQVHFSNKVFGRSLDVDVIDGVAAIPDILLQTDKELTAWAFVGTAENGYTKISKAYKVNRRNKPADYVFTPTDQTTLGEIIERIEDLEKRPNGGNGGITKEVDPTVPDWAKQPQKPTYTAPEVGALPDTTKIPSTAEDVGALPANAFIPKTATDVGAIPVPETATVGQTPVVKEVDESGKPTSWECVDVAGGTKLLVDYITEQEIFTSEISDAEFSEDLSGNSFCFKNVMVRVSGTVVNDVDTDSSVRIWLNGLSTSPIIMTPTSLNSDSTVYAIISADNASRCSAITVAKTIGVQTLPVSVDNITAIKISGNNYNKTHLAAGASIKIWGWD